MLDIFRDSQARLLDSLTYTTHRFLYNTFDVSSRLTGLVGPRGVGKTTLLLQYIKARGPSRDRVLYFSADHIYLNKVGLYDLVKEAYEMEGISLFVIDEVHKYAGWNQELKNLYDAFPDIRIVFSGSSSLDLIKGSYDLSRRATIYRLPGLSFREYLQFEVGLTVEAQSLDALMANHQALARELSGIPRLKGLFQSYLRAGYYPFALQNEMAFADKMAAVVEKTIHQDIASFYSLKTANLHYFKKILYFLTTIPPGEINTHNLARNLGIDDKTTQHYIEILRETGLVRMLLADAQGGPLVRKASKVYLDNPTLYHATCAALGETPNTGTMRELFFVCMLQNQRHEVRYRKRDGDFRVGDTVFEVGGKRKSARQIRDVGDAAYLVKDDILLGGSRSVPLYLFGFLY